MNRKVTTLVLIVSWLVTACSAATPAIPTPTVEPTRTPVPSRTSAPTATSTPVPGPQLVDVDGRGMYIECRGSGSPVVILEAGLGIYSGTWFEVFPEVAEFTRVCVFDRFGLGSSEMGELPRTSERMTFELHTLLTNAEVPGPYILVAHSFAGLNARLFASTYPEEVAGLVLVDAVHPDLDERIELLLSPTLEEDRRELIALNPEGLRFEDMLTSEEQVRAAGPIPNVPLVVIRHGLPFEGAAGWPTEKVEMLWEELQIDLATLSTDSTVVLAETSAHRIQEDQPQLVVDAIRQVFEKVKQ